MFKQMRDGVGKNKVQWQKYCVSKHWRNLYWLMWISDVLMLVTIYPQKKGIVKRILLSVLQGIVKRILLGVLQLSSKPLLKPIVG